MEISHVTVVVAGGFELRTLLARYASSYLATGNKLRSIKCSATRSYFMLLVIVISTAASFLLQNYKIFI